MSDTIRRLDELAAKMDAVGYRDPTADVSVNALIELFGDLRNLLADCRAALSTPSGFDAGIEAAAKALKQKSDEAFASNPHDKTKTHVAWSNAADLVRSISPSGGERASIVAFLRGNVAQHLPRFHKTNIRAVLTALADAIARCDDQRTDHTAGGG